MAKMVWKFWNLQYLALSDETKQKLDEIIHNKLREKIELPDHYKSIYFPYLSHLQKLMQNLLRVDVSLEFELGQSWGPLHNALGITSIYCEQALNVINETLSAQFDDLYSADLEYLFSSIYRSAAYIMFGHNEQGFLNKILNLDHSQKEIIAKSLKNCLNDKCGKDIIFSYLQSKDPRIYLFWTLFAKYNESPDDQQRKNKILSEIQRVCIDAEAMFSVEIDDIIRNQFNLNLHSIQENNDGFQQIEELLILIQVQQMNIVRNSYWKTFSLLIF